MPMVTRARHMAKAKARIARKRLGKLRRRAHRKSRKDSRRS